MSKFEVADSDCPASVSAGIQFIQMCLSHRRDLVRTIFDDEEIIDGESTGILQGVNQSLEIEEMLPKQAAAFDMACNLVGTYFRIELDRLHPAAKQG